MVETPANDDDPALQETLDALHDADCRAVLAALSEPMTANELMESCDIPKSTLYRKLDLLCNASLVRELVEVGADGGRVSRYERNVTDVTVSVDDEVSVSIDRPARQADERLANLWAEMREEL